VVIQMLGFSYYSRTVNQLRYTVAYKVTWTYITPRGQINVRGFLAKSNCQPAALHCRLPSDKAVLRTKWPDKRKGFY